MLYVRLRLRCFATFINLTFTLLGFDSVGLVRLLELM